MNITVNRFKHIIRPARLFYTGGILLSALYLSCQNQPPRPDVIENWTISHSGDAGFIPQVRALIDSVADTSPEELEGFVRQIADVLCREHKELLAISVAAYPHGIDLPGDEYSEIGKRLLIQLQLPGSPAPALPLRQADHLKATGLLVLFFDSDCPSCHPVIDELKMANDSLESAGLRVVSIASDWNADRYKSFAETLPWADRYCDYRSFEGDYFKAWGVASTPALYYVNQQGIVEGEFRHLKDLAALIDTGR